MTNNSQSRSYSRRSAGVLLLVGVLAGVTVGGGVGVLAASSTKSVTVCVDKKDNHMNYSKDSKCKSHQNKVVLNQKGAAGAKGEPGSNGVGTKGDTGDDGADGAPGSLFSARNVCGANGATLCAVGEQGPGGGTVFYLDTEGKYSDFDYLEVASEDASTGVARSTTTQQCGLTATSCTNTYVTTSGEALNFWAIGTARAATAAIVARHNAGTPVTKTSYAAGVADDYTTATASDWFLPSKDELNELCKYARNTGQAAGASTVCTGGTLRSGFSPGGYWGSSENDAPSAWIQDLGFGYRAYASKTDLYFVRPVRAF